MQTFLPYPDFEESAKCLDYRRLGKQRVEAWQIYLALTKPGYGWQSHPAVRMWSGYESILLEYGIEICREWQRRGFKDSLLERFLKEWGKKDFQFEYPFWMGNKKFHASHRSNLLRKDPVYYGKFGWSESTTLPYVWP